MCVFFFNYLHITYHILLELNYRILMIKNKINVKIITNVKLVLNGSVSLKDTYVWKKIFYILFFFMNVNYYK